MQEITTTANSFSPFSETDSMSKDTKIEKITPRTKTPILKNVVVCRTPNFKSSALILVSKAKLRYRTITAVNVHPPTKRIEKISFLTVRTIKRVKKERYKMRLLFLFA